MGFQGTYSGDAYLRETITVGVTPVGLSSASIVSPTGQRAQSVFISVEGDSIRFSIDGTDPTDSEGHPASAGDTLGIDGGDNVKSLRMVRDATAAVDATVTITYHEG
jgi:hypothetical protein